MARKAERLQVLDQLTPPDLWPDIREREPRRPPEEPRTPRRALVAALALAIAAVAIAFAVRAFEVAERTPRPASTVENGKIAFSSQGDIFLMEPDGSSAINLTRTDDFWEIDPAWSPDGTQIAFVGCGDCDTSDLYLMNADGTGVSRLTHDDALDGSPAWSPDGTRIAYHSDPGATWSETEGLTPGNEDIRIVSPDGTGQQDVTTGPERDIHPSWSPDGRSLAFMRQEATRTSSIYVTDLQGAEWRITPVSVWAGYPSWSPDGTRIAFAVLDQSATTADLYLVGIDGDDLRRLTDFEGVAWGGPVWSPDGRQIALWAHRGQPGIYLAEPEGEGMQLLTEVEDVEGISWQRVIATTSPAPTELTEPIEPRVTAEIPVGSFPRDIAVGAGAVWATVNDFHDGEQETHSLLRIDRATNEIVATIPVGSAGHLAVGFDAVWTIDSIEGEDALVRIDPGSNEVVATIPVGRLAFDVAVDASGVWVTRDIDSRSGEVIRIDPVTNEIVARIPVEGRIRDVVVGEGGVWVVDSTSTLREEPSLIHIDSGTNQVVATIPGLAGLEAVAGDGLVWIQGWLSTVDPAAGTGAGDRPVALRIDPERTRSWVTRSPWTGSTRSLSGRAACGSWTSAGVPPSLA
jgi:Tol biopolymer transport system component